MSDQARNVKKAFAKAVECVDVVQITQELLNRQWKVDLIARRKQAKKDKELIREEVAVSELTEEIEELNTVSPSSVRRRSIRREHVLVELDDDECSDEITTTDSDQCGSGSPNITLAMDNSLNDAVSDEVSEMMYEAELRQIDEELDEAAPSKL